MYTWSIEGSRAKKLNKWLKNNNCTVSTWVLIERISLIIPMSSSSDNLLIWMASIPDVPFLVASQNNRASRHRASFTCDKANTISARAQNTDLFRILCVRTCTCILVCLTVHLNTVGSHEADEDCSKPTHIKGPLALCSTASAAVDIFSSNPVFTLLMQASGRWSQREKTVHALWLYTALCRVSAKQIGEDSVRANCKSEFAQDMGKMLKAGKR